jgi:hypothetical protein
VQRSPDAQQQWRRDSSVLWRDASGNVGMWPMNGSSISQSNVLPSNVPTSWSMVGQRDFNYDDNADILWRDNSGNVGIWLMNNTTIASTLALGNVPTNWSVCGFNGLHEHYLVRQKAAMSASGP